MIGQIKSAIEKKLLESYSNNTFSYEIKNFKKLVLENKNISKLFFLYDELGSKKGLKNDLVDSYINECIKMYENTINKIKPNEFNILKAWIKSTDCKNSYHDIDNLFSTNVLTLETKVQSRKLISENLKSEPEGKKEIINIPLSSSLSIANKVISEHIENLSITEKKELIQLISTPDKQLNEEFNSLKNETISKLEKLKEDTDEETSKRILETIEKVKNEKFDKLNYYKMKVLSENI